MSKSLRPGLGIKINTRRKVEGCCYESGDIVLRWTKDRNKRTTVRLTRKAAGATLTLLVQLLKGAA
jgi:hypothetical protein